MTVPTKEQFDIFLRTIEDSAARNLQDSLTKQLVLSNRDAAIQLIGDLISERHRKTDLIQEDTVYQWLSSHSAFARMIRALRSRDRSGDLHDTDSQRATKIFDWMKKTAESDSTRGGERFRKRKEILFGTHRRSETVWIHRFVSALIEYHFTDSTRQIVENRRKFRSRVAAAIAGMRALRELGSDQAIVNRFHALQAYSGPAIPLIDSTSRKRLGILLRMQTTHIDSMYPIARLDDTARERLFVLRIARANQLCFGKSKSALIADLMGFEGFDHQLDERTIERHCATAVQVRRQLFGELQETSDVTVV
ncbi:conserved hypothetical protein [Paraburkholderia sacchari]|uniref:hypothetical protein n=1 Tax=Paraburkholderia sacchari TaxID=159450 RepID=UPI0039A455AE